MRGGLFASFNSLQHHPHLGTPPVAADYGCGMTSSPLSPIGRLGVIYITPGRTAKHFFTTVQIRVNGTVFRG
jgi:hypothetical protein